MKKLSYRSARLVILVLMVVGLLAMIVSSYVAKDGSAARMTLFWVGVGLYAVALFLVWFAFRCPACGLRFFKNGLFMSRCPFCGADFAKYRDRSVFSRPCPLPEDRQDGGE